MSKADMKRLWESCTGMVITSSQGRQLEDSDLIGSTFKIDQSQWLGCSSVVEHLSSMNEASGLIPSTANISNQAHQLYSDEFT
jgi:hypothetical protein